MRTSYARFMDTLTPDERFVFPHSEISDPVSELKYACEHGVLLTRDMISAAEKYCGYKGVPFDKTGFFTSVFLANITRAKFFEGSDLGKYSRFSAGVAKTLAEKHGVSLQE